MPTNISWTDEPWNPWQGCIKVSSGCKYCYMYREKDRYGQQPDVVIRSSPATFNKPLPIKEPGKMFFTCSWSDFFIEQADPWRDEAWDIIRKTPHLTYQILTKRPERIGACLPPDWGGGWPNVWLGVSVENQDYTSRMDILRQIPAGIRFISAEPLLDYIDLNLEGFHWVITGGESGNIGKFREAKLDWFRHIRDQCQAAGIPYFHKQNGGSHKIDGEYGGYVYDGQSYREFPAKTSPERLVMQPSQLSLF